MYLCCKCGGILWNQPLKITKWAISRILNGPCAWCRPPAVESGLGPFAGNGERPAIPNQQAFKAGLAGLRGLRLSLKTLWWSWRWRWRWKRTHWTPIWPLQWPKKSQPPLEGKIFIVHPFNGPRYGFSPPKNNYVRNIYRIFSITLWTYKNY